MIIYGTRGKQLKHVVAVDKTCSHCENTEHVAVGVIRYVHIFWIPLLMYSKKVFRQCIHCKQTNEMPQVEKDTNAESIKSLFSFKNTWMYFMGLWLFFILILISAISTAFAG
jgi:hypothetical protein